MQDSLLHLCQKSFQNYLDFISHFVPKSVTINSTHEVINVYKNNFALSSKDLDALFSVQLVRPLFQIELLKNIEENVFTYSKLPKTIVQTV